MIIHHMSIGVLRFERAIAFYDQVLAPLGIEREAFFREPAGTRSAGYGRKGQQAERDAAPFRVEERQARIVFPPGFHVAFAAPSRAAVEAFHAAGLAGGARDNGPPGLRPVYAPNYFAAFLIDPDGWHIEAVTYSAS